MRKALFLLMIFVFIGACGEKKKTETTGPRPITKADIKTKDQEISYALGYRLGSSFNRDYFKLDESVYWKGFQDGLKNCKIRLGNDYFSYNMGLIDDYKFYYKNDVIFQYSPKLSDKIISIKVGIWFENQRNDTLFVDTTLVDDSTEFKVGLILTSKSGALSFVEIPQLEFVRGTVSFANIPGTVAEYRMTPPKVSNKIFYYWGGYYFYIEDLVLSPEKGVNIVLGRGSPRYHVEVIP